ncbi:MAG: type II toxin-antitoxin system Phd/YefM family antitoxin [Candidatus Hydrogenedentes bacterium]|nr:type II toxin-antitoxin system Phd/YefM family antitoxin [Candidatus Hydrogenedentota bacterium]
MEKTWQLQEARNHFSEVVERAMTAGPQIVSRHGKPAVVVPSCEAYDRLTDRSESLVAFLRASPLRGHDLERQRDLPAGSRPA